MSHMSIRHIHCHGPALQIAVGDTIKAIKIIRETLGADFILNKLIKSSMV